MFSLPTNTKAKLLDVVVLSQKNRQPDDNPGAKLVLQMSLTNDVLIEFDGSLRSFLFTRAASSPDPQAKLEGVPAVTDAPDLTGVGSHVGTLKWHQDMTGYALTVDFGMGGKRNLELGDCTLSKWRLTPKEGGTVVAKVNVDAPDVAEGAFGKLAKLKSREIEIKLTPPEVAQQPLNPGAAWPFPKGGAAAGDAPPQSTTVENVKAPKGRKAAQTPEEALAATQAGAAAH